MDCEELEGPQIPPTRLICPKSIKIWEFALIWGHWRNWEGLEGIWDERGAPDPQPKHPKTSQKLPNPPRIPSHPLSIPNPSAKFGNSL